MTDLLEANDQLLAQGVSLCGQLSPDLFSRSHPSAPGGTPGAHLRHCIEHYECLLDSTTHRRLDYALRPRHERLETDPLLAAERLGQLRRRLSQQLATTPPGTPLAVRADVESVWLSSSFARELQFLASHTVHHFALVAILLRLSGATPPADFGVAPSTLKFRSQKPTCAA